MGLCLSCLAPASDVDERTSLLASDAYSENLQEDLLKQQQRQSELNVIVSDLSDNLIDVLTFLTHEPTSPGRLAPLSPKLAADERQFPYLYTADEKRKILQEVAQLPPLEPEISAAPKSLYVGFGEQ